MNGHPNLIAANIREQIMHNIGWWNGPVYMKCINVLVVVMRKLYMVLGNLN